MEVKPAFNFMAQRARLARLAHTFARASVADGFLFAALTALTAGALLVILAKMPIGWLVAGLAGPLGMVGAWGAYELRALPAVPGSTALEDAVDAPLLGLLPREHTALQLALIVANTPAGVFFGRRFGLDFRLMAPLMDQSPLVTEQVWIAALRLRDTIQAPSVDASILAAAIVETMPDRDRCLAYLRLEMPDVVHGAAWFHHIREVIEEHKQRPSGGIGRNWSFGYTPLLSQFAANITDQVTYQGILAREVPSRSQMAGQIMHLLLSGGRRNVALVGGLGSGKTMIVHALAKKLAEGGRGVPQELRYRQVFALDPARIIAQAQSRGQLEGLVQHLFYEALQAKNALLFLDDAQLFFEDGAGSVNIANVLLPALEGGALQLIMAMDEHRWTQITKQNPALAQYINRLSVVPPSEEETMAIMQNQALLSEHRQKVTYMYQALDAAYKLSERYGSDQVMPGRALHVMEAAAQTAENGIVTYHSVEMSLEQSLGVKVATADTAAERETLLNLEDRIHERMINQTRAVQVVSDALRRARAGVRNPKRPIGTFLFLGPTGVGKTELTKSVGAVFFGGEDRLVRLDLNEFSGAEDVARLIADPTQDSHSLTAQISRQPFSVVLLDEIEKAHPNVLNTLLQLLDEGILRDSTNREVSFRDAIIIATSNAGADRLRTHIDAGEQLEDFETQFTNELIDAQVFRPEFLNRFDEIVLFRPLNEAELKQVVDLLIDSVNKELSTQKVRVAIDEASKDLLVRAGYDPRLGARPMRRVVQRVVENIVAQRLLAGQAGPGQTIQIGEQDVRQMLARR